MPQSTWRDDLARAIVDPAHLPAGLVLTAGEKRFFETPLPTHRLPLRVTAEVAGTMETLAGGASGNAAGSPAGDPLRRQFIPSDAELEVRQWELADPLGEEQYTPVPRLIHRYPDRALLLTTDQCAVHCRHCFRSRFTGTGQGTVTNDELAAVGTYLGEHEEIRELLLSGGDALMVPDEDLADIISTARRARPRIVIRVATRMPVVLPSRVTAGLITLLAGAAPVWVVLQVNHPAELTSPARAAITALADAGIPLLNQSVLLAGVNDNAETLEALFTSLVRLRVKPYYLFQGDLAPGTGHFRVNLERALSFVAELRRRISGLAMPVFAVDIPGGGGKVPLEPGAVAGRDEEGYQLRALDGTVHHYPVE